MKRLFGITLAVAITSWCRADEPQAVPAEILAGIVDDDPRPLPRYMTAEEALLPLPMLSAADRLRLAPPSGTVYTPTEYEQNDGFLVSWKSYTSVLTELIVGVTTGDPDAIAYVVASSSAQPGAQSTLTSAGADMSRVEFIIYDTTSVWIRDYGPRFISEDGTRAMVDHTYNRPRPADDAFTDFLSPAWGEPQYDIPLVHGGGNFHLFTNGDAFMSNLVLTENPGLSEQDVKDYFLAYQNLDLTIYPGFPTSFDSTRHIDMWMLPVADDEIIIGQYDVSTGQPYTITESAVADLVSRGYTVYRTPGWQSGGTHYTYTNAVVMNDVVAISEFSGYPTENAQALAVFETAFPDRQVFPVDSSSIIHAAGAIHCIMTHVPVVIADALTIELPDGVPEYIPPGVPSDMTVQIQDVGETYVPGSGLLHYRYDDGDFSTNSLASLGGDLYQATLPAPACDDTPEFYISAEGDGGTTVYSPEDAPAGVYTTEVATVTVILDDDFETDQGWTVVNDPSLTGGAWERGIPVEEPDATRHPPQSDYDGSGRCYLTENVVGNSDVDNGPTMLISPTFDLSDAIDPILRFAYWWSNDDPDSDPMDIEISNDDGATWVPALTIANVPDEWFQQVIYIASAIDPLPLTAQMKVRISVLDEPNDSKDEGGIDAMRVLDISCAVPGSGDFDGDGDVDELDGGHWEECLTGPDNGPYDNPNCVAFDFDGDDDVDLEDFSGFVIVFEGP